MSNPAPTVYVVDDDPSILKAIERLLRSDRRQVATFDSAQAFLDGHDPAVPGCLVLDFSMPGLNGLQLQQTLIDQNCMRPIIFLTGRGDVPITVQAMKRGAIDFLTKPVDGNALLNTVAHAIEQDHIHQQARAECAEIQQRLKTLTPREREVLGYVVAGKLNKQIAGILGTGEKTVKVHRARAMEKMQARSLAELVRLAAQAGIVPKDV